MKLLGWKISMQNFKTLITMLKQVIYIFNEKQRRNSMFLFLSMMFVSVLETLGVSVVIPFIIAILSPEELLNNKYIVAIKRYIPLDTYQSMIVFTAGIIIAVLLKMEQFC